jgi:outer membrane lipoprotein SlyB
MKKMFVLLVAASSVLILSGCVVTPTSGSVYRPGQTQNEMQVRFAIVESVREVTIQHGQSGVGTMTGAALGGLAGSTLGNGRGNVAGAVVGAVLGGAIGSNVENSSNMRRGLEITVRLENGEFRAITQEAGEQFRPGERVRLISDRRMTRVTH